MRGSKECHNAEEDCAATGMRQRAPRRWMSRFRVALSQFLVCEAGDINPKTLALPLIVLPLSLAVASSCFSQPVEGVLRMELSQTSAWNRHAVDRRKKWRLDLISIVLNSLPFSPSPPTRIFFSSQRGGSWLLH